MLDMHTRGTHTHGAHGTHDPLVHCWACEMFKEATLARGERQARVVRHASSGVELFVLD